MEQTLMDKLTILADSAKYDVACTSSGASPTVPGRAVRDAPLEVQATSYLALSARMVSLSIRVCSMQNAPPKRIKPGKRVKK